MRAISKDAERSREIQLLQDCVSISQMWKSLYFLGQMTLLPSFLPRFNGNIRRHSRVFSGCCLFIPRQL